MWVKRNSHYSASLRRIALKPSVNAGYKTNTMTYVHIALKIDSERRCVFGTVRIISTDYTSVMEAGNARESTKTT